MITQYDEVGAPYTEYDCLFDRIAIMEHKSLTQFHFDRIKNKRIGFNNGIFYGVLENLLNHKYTGFRVFKDGKLEFKK